MSKPNDLDRLHAAVRAAADAQAAMKFKVGQVVTSTVHAAWINQRGTYVVKCVWPDNVMDDGLNRPYFIRPLVGRIPLASKDKFYRLHGAWARECQLQALPGEDMLLQAAVEVVELQAKRSPALAAKQRRLLDVLKAPL